MVLPRDLDDWLTEAGDRVVHKMAAGRPEALRPMERLVYEVWLFDTETRNGGASQYFCNRGMRVGAGSAPRLRATACQF